jgi:hypothetical protein
MKWPRRSCVKLDSGLTQSEKGGQARDRLLKLFDASLLYEAIEAIEDLLKIINLDGKPGGAIKK